MDRNQGILYPFPMPYKFEKVSNILSVIMKEHGFGAKIDEYKILKIWDRTVGNDISIHTMPLRSIRGVLTVVVDSPVWVQQLVFYKEDIIKKINDLKGKKVINDIRFKVGRIEQKKDTIDKTQDLRTETPLSSHQSEKIEGYLEPIKDDEIKRVIKRTITKALIKKRW